MRKSSAMNKTYISLKQFSSCDISGISESDFLDALGKLNLINHLPLITLKTSTPIRICGPAHTVKFIQKDQDCSLNAVANHIDIAPPGSVIVISTPSETPNAVWLI
jgi:regulator of RNase E activity RraA